MTTSEERNTFSQFIEQFATDKRISYLEAILEHCEESGLEVQVASTLINRSLKEKIEIEARDRRLIVGGKTSKLPI